MTHSTLAFDRLDGELWVVGGKNENLPTKENGLMGVLCSKIGTSDYDRGSEIDSPSVVILPGVVDPDMRKKEFIAFSMSECCGGKEGGLGELKINDWHF